MLYALMNVLGYKSNERGVCFGLANMAMQAFLSGDIERFDSRLNYILNNPPNKIKDLIEADRNALKKEGAKNNNTMFQDDSETEIIRSMAAFLEGIELYMNPQRYKEFFEPTQTRFVQDTLLSSRLTSSKKIESADGLAEVDNFCGAYDNDEMRKYFSSFATAVKQAELNKPVNMLLSSSNHAMSVGYDPVKEEFIFTGARQMPVKYTKNVDEIVNYVRKEFGVYEGHEYATIFNTKIYSLKSDENESKKAIQLWHESNEWNQIHTITSTKAKSLNAFHETLLHMAAMEGDLNLVKALVEQGANINLFTRDNSMALHMAVQYGHLDVVKYIIEQSVNINAIPTSVLSIAAELGYLDIVRYLVEKGVNLNSFDSYVTPRYRAAQNGHLDVLNYLIEHSGQAINVNQPETNEYSLLWIAASKGHFEIVKSLIDKGANLNQSNQNGSTPLHMAVQNGHYNVAKYLIEKGANINQPNRYGSTPLHVGAEAGDLPIVEYLVGHGANINLPNEQGLSAHCLAVNNNKTTVADYLAVYMADVKKNAKIALPGKNNPDQLMKAILSGNNDLLISWVKQGLPINEIDKNGIPPLLVTAVDQGNMVIVKYLVENGANINIGSKSAITPLRKAAEKGHVEIAQYLIEKGADLNAAVIEGETPLYIAVRYGNFAVVKSLVENGANFNLQDKTGFSPFLLAIFMGYRDIVDYFVEQKHANVNLIAKKDMTPLLTAVRRGNFEMVKYLIEQGANINMPNQNGMTALHAAAQNGSLEIVKYLTEKGADINLPNNQSMTATLLANKNQKVDIVKYLIEKGASTANPQMNDVLKLSHAIKSSNIDLTRQLIEKGVAFNVEREDVTPPLLIAIAKGNIDIVKLLVEHGANFNISTKNGITALDVAAQYGHFAIINYLVEKGADFNLINQNGFTPLHTATQYGQLAIVKYLIEKGADFYIQEKNSQPPLFQAVFNGHLDIINYLVKEKRANVNMLNKAGLSLLHIASESGQFAIVNYLVENGADVNALKKDSHDLYPFMSALRKGHKDIVNYLIEKGADVNHIPINSRLEYFVDYLTIKLNIEKPKEALTQENKLSSIKMILKNTETTNYVVIMESIRKYKILPAEEVNNLEREFVGKTEKNEGITTQISLKAMQSGLLFSTTAENKASKESLAQLKDILNLLQEEPLHDKVAALKKKIEDYIYPLSSNSSNSHNESLALDLIKEYVELTKENLILSQKLSGL